MIQLTENEIQHLVGTQLIFRTLHKVQAVLQILDFASDKSNPEYIQITLSDGTFFFDNFIGMHKYFLPSAIAKYQVVKINCVISHAYDQRNAFFIKGVSILDNPMKLIGNPIDVNGKKEPQVKTFRVLKTESLVLKKKENVIKKDNASRRESLKNKSPNISKRESIVKKESNYSSILVRVIDIVHRKINSVQLLVKDANAVSYHLEIKDNFVQKFNNIRLNMVYSITEVKVSEKCITITKDSQIIPIEGANVLIPMEEPSTVRLSQIESLSSGCFQLFVYVCQVKESNYSHGGKTFKYAEIKKLVITDESFCEIELLLLYSFARMEIAQWDILYLKNIGIIKTEVGIQLETFVTSIIERNPGYNKDTELKSLLQNYKGFTTSLTYKWNNDISKRITISELVYLTYHNKLERNYYMKAYIQQIIPCRNMCFNICRKCSTKLCVEIEGWRCNKCKRVTPEQKNNLDPYAAPLLVYCQIVNIRDFTGMFSAFFTKEAAQKLLKVTPKEYEKACEEKDSAENVLLSDIIKHLINQEFIFSVRAQVNSVDAKEKILVRVLDFYSPDRKFETKQTLKVIQQQLFG